MVGDPERARRPARSRSSQVRWPDREEIHLSVWPEMPGSPRSQLEAVYQELAGALERAGAAREQVVFERLFLAAPFPSLFEAAPLAGTGSWSGYRPARFTVLEPPCESGRACELQALVARPLRPSLGAGPARVFLPAGPRAVTLERAGRLEIHLGGVTAPSALGFFEETLQVFEAAERELELLGASFRDVARTWIHLSDMARDYGELNRGRRSFFGRLGIVEPPASTAIGGRPLSREEPGRPSPRLSLSLHAVQAEGRRPFFPVRSPTLNEAGDYGSDFSRGMRLEDTAGGLLHISGTASVDEEGRSVAPGDLERQVDRALRNLEALLAGQGARFGEVVSAVTYLKDRRLLNRYRERVAGSGLLDLPHAIVEAEICRAELLCEVELVAALRPERPEPGPGESDGT